MVKFGVCIGKTHVRAQKIFCNLIYWLCLNLRCGDSLYGERLASVRGSLAKLGNLFNDSQITGLVNAAQTLSEINAINDVDLQEVERSRSLMEQAYGLLDGLIIGIAGRQHALVGPAGQCIAGQRKHKVPVAVGEESCFVDLVEDV